MGGLTEIHGGISLAGGESGQVGPAAEVSPIPGNNNALYVIVGLELIKRLIELGHHVGIEGIGAVGTVQDEPAYFGLFLYFNLNKLVFTGSVAVKAVRGTA